MKYPKGIDGSLDKIFKDLVRGRTEHICENCGTDNAHDTRKSHTAHIHSRKHRATRWHSDGAVCLCASCHRHFTDFPVKWQDAARRILGEVRYERAYALHNSIRKYTKAEKAEMLKHYKAEKRRMEQRRKDGETGYLEFVGYD